MSERIIELNKKKMIGDEIAKISSDNEDVKILMTIPGINVYSAAAIMSEIDDISRFPSKEKLASYAVIVQAESIRIEGSERSHIEE